MNHEDMALKAPSARQRVRGRVSFIVMALLLLIGAGFAAKYYFFPDADKQAKPSTPVQTVTLARVEQRDFPLLLDTTGTTVAANLVDIRPQITNTVQKVHIKEGQMVRSGDVLFTLDDRADRANVAKAQAALDDAKRQYARAQELISQKFVSQSSVDTTQALIESAQASLRAAEVALSYDTIRSPITGRAGIINVFPGALVQPGNTVSTSTTATATTAIGAMVTITQLDIINVQFTVPESALPMLFASIKAGTMPVAILTTTDGKKREGKVYVVDNQIDTSIGAVKVKAQVNNQDHALIPGQFVNVTLNAGSIKDALVVPSQAVVSNARGQQLFVVDEQNGVELKPIKVLSEGQGYAVVSGVKAQDKIVVEGKQNLRPGFKVREAKSEAKGTSAPANQPAAHK
jgi:RND family efflux transporter MFP subunit